MSTNLVTKWSNWGSLSLSWTHIHNRAPTENIHPYPRGDALAIALVWDPWTWERFWVRTHWCAGESPSLPLSLTWGVPMACQVRSAVVHEKQQEKCFANLSGELHINKCAAPDCSSKVHKRNASANLACDLSCILVPQQTKGTYLVNVTNMQKTLINFLVFLKATLYPWTSILEKKRILFKREIYYTFL